MSSLQKNMLWNAAGNAIYLGAQWLITIFVTILDGFSDAGVLSIAMSLSATFQTLALFGIRNYQVSDAEGKYSDTNYVSFRFFCCVASLVVCIAASLIGGYRGQTLLAVFLFMLFRLAECYSDVLHGVAQNRDRLDIAGKSFALKGAGILLAFFLPYYFTRHLNLALAAMALVALAVTLCYDIPATKKLSDFRFFDSFGHCKYLALTALPLCVYQFLYAAVASLPKLILGKMSGEVMLGAYSSIYAPAMLLQSASGYLYIPFATKFTSLWKAQKRRNFAVLFVKLSLAIAALFGAVLVLAQFFGEWALVWVFGEQIRAFVYLLDPILLLNFAISYLAFLSMVVIVLRRVALLLCGYALGFACAAILPSVFITHFGTNGTSYATLVAAGVPCAVFLCGIVQALLSKQTVQADGETVSGDVHTFVLCAYRESPYLEDCVRSLLAQTVSSQIIICTATPNDTIASVAEKYRLPLCVREGTPAITDDWNFAMSQVQTPYATIAHQDDIYEPTYLEKVLQKAQGAENPILVFTDYYEIRNGARVAQNKLLSIKRKMNRVMAFFPNRKWWRRRVMAFGNSICCPSVTYCMANYGDFAFDGNYRFACDWDAWERLGNQKGAFLYLSEPLMGHRIHADSETTKQSESSRRGEEEYAMFCRFWPKWIAKRLASSYKKGADSNKV